MMSEIVGVSMVGGTRLKQAALDAAVDAVRVVGRGVDLLLINEEKTLREAGNLIRSVLAVPKPRPPLRLEGVPGGC
jgi:hypothetical protein